MEGPGEIRTGRSTAPRSRGALRVFQTIAVWLVIVGLFAGLGYGVWLAVKDSPARIDETLVRARASTSIAHAAEPVVAPGLGEPAAPSPETTAGEPLLEVVNPTWEVLPHARYPRGQERVEASVALKCEVSPDGRLTHCEIVEETPPGLGFGRAALEAAGRARLKPRMVQGEPTAGDVRFNIRFTPG